MKTRSYRDDLIRALRHDPEFAILYLLNASLDIDGMFSDAFETAWRDVREAYEDKLEEARKL